MFAILHLEDVQGKLRYKGFTEAVEAAGLRPEDQGFFWLDNIGFQDLERVADYLFERLEGHTGVLCYNDEVAFKLIQLAQKRGIGIPEDLSVVSIDNSNLADICPVPFTSCFHPKEKLGVKAAENLLRMIEDPSFNGNYQYMQLLKYFIWKNKVTGEEVVRGRIVGEVERQSQLAAWLENTEDKSSNNDWDLTLK
jgi:GntR family transcriptional regulator of arabinose operon